VNPLTGQEQSWQRASNYAAPLDNPHGLIRWQLRALVMGLSMRQDLARMLLTGAVINDKDKADEVIASALTAAETDSAANEGTAVHSALSRSFLGHEVPAEYVPHVAAFAAELHRNGLAPVATEVRMLCVSLGVIGHTDWIVRTQDGRHLILDVKTGKFGDAKRKFAIQCKAYAGAEYIDDGKGGWIPVPFALDQTEAVLAHVDPITGATALYRVDLVLGLYGATLAERVRDWNKIEVLSPYTPVHHAIPTTALAVGLGQATEAAMAHEADVANRTATYGSTTSPNAVVADLGNGPAVYVSEDGTPFAGTTAVAAHPTQSPVAEPASVPSDFDCFFCGQPANRHPIGDLCDTPETHPGVTVNEHGSGGVTVNEHRTPLTPWRMIDGATSLQTLDMAERAAKRSPVGWTAELQQLAGLKRAEINAKAEAPTGAERLGGITVNEAGRNLSEATRQLSAHDGVAQLGRLDELMHTRNTKSMLQKTAKDLGCTDLAHDRKWLALWIIATESGADPVRAAAYAKSKGTIPIDAEHRVEQAQQRPAAEQTPFALKHISEAATFADIERFRLNIVTRSGDHAWTDEMAEAARERMAELSSAAAPTHPTALILGRIAVADQPQAIAQLWESVTLGGSAPEQWTAEIRAAADARLAELARTASAPTNPYGPQQ
jgi:hypothetical protein